MRRIEPVTNFDLVRHFGVMKKTAITKDIIILAENDRELRRQTSLIPSEEFLQ